MGWLPVWGKGKQDAAPSPSSVRAEVAGQADQNAIGPHGLKEAGLPGGVADRSPGVNNAAAIVAHLERHGPELAALKRVVVSRVPDGLLDAAPEDLNATTPHTAIAVAQPMARESLIGLEGITTEFVEAKLPPLLLLVACDPSLGELSWSNDDTPHPAAAQPIKGVAIKLAPVNAETGQSVPAKVYPAVLVPPGATVFIGDQPYKTPNVPVTDTIPLVIGNPDAATAAFLASLQYVSKAGDQIELGKGPDVACSDTTVAIIKARFNPAGPFPKDKRVMGATSRRHCAFQVTDDGTLLLVPLSITNKVILCRKGEDTFQPVESPTPIAEGDTLGVYDHDGAYVLLTFPPYKDWLANRLQTWSPPTPPPSPQESVDEEHTIIGRLPEGLLRRPQ